MVLPEIDVELEEMDEYDLFHHPVEMSDPVVRCQSNHQIHVEGVPSHLIIGVTETAHTFINGFGFKNVVGHLTIGSIKLDINSNHDGSVWSLNLCEMPEPNKVAAAIVEKIPVNLTSIIDLVSNDQMYSEGAPVQLVKLESSSVNFKSKLPRLAIPGFISGISAALLSMVIV